jgi:hypothetical protein
MGSDCGREAVPWKSAACASSPAIHKSAGNADDPII